MTAKTVKIANLEVSNEKPFTLFAGMNVLESRELALKIAEEFKLVTDELKLPFVLRRRSTKLIVLRLIRFAARASMRG